MVLPQELSTVFPSEESLIRNTNFLRSDHIRFWFANNVDYYASFKSVHISDTGTKKEALFVRQDWCWIDFTLIKLLRKKSTEYSVITYITQKDT